jgi:hypothetical protein
VKIRGSHLVSEDEYDSQKSVINYRNASVVPVYDVPPSETGIDLYLM